MSPRFGASVFFGTVDPDTQAARAGLEPLARPAAALCAAEEDPGLVPFVPNLDDPTYSKRNGDVSFQKYEHGARVTKALQPHPYPHGASHAH